MRAEFFQLLGHADVILQRIFWPALVENVAGVANGRFADGAVPEHRIDCHAHVLDGVERIEDAENVDALGVSFAHEFLDDVVGIGSVTDRICSAKQHLEANVRNAPAQLAQTLPRIFMQETQRGVECCAAPHFEAEKIGKPLGHSVGSG